MKIKRIISILLIITLISLCGCSIPEKSEEKKENNITTVSYIKAVWLTYFELQDIISNSKTEKDFKKSIKDVFKNIKDKNLNTVSVQVRPCADAFYNSSYFPTSKYCFGEEGCELPFDPLKIMCDVADDVGLRIEAWINPYRVSQEENIDALSENNIAKKWYNDKEKKSNVYINDKIYFNPASSDVTDLIVNGVKEIAENYNVDSISFDDYFYPTTDEDIDKAEYSKYKDGGGDLSLSSWRRDNVSNMIKNVYKAIKEINSNITFGISPQAKIDTDFETLYADVEKWGSEDGYCDYICPQVYFGFYNETMPFTRTVKEWAALANSTNLLIGIPLYKSGIEDAYASDDKDYAINEFIDNNDIIARQISYIEKIDKISGFYIFSYSYLEDEDNTAVVEEVSNMMSVIK